MSLAPFPCSPPFPSQNLDPNTHLHSNPITSLCVFALFKKACTCIMDLMTCFCVHSISLIKWIAFYGNVGFIFSFVLRFGDNFK